MFNYITKKTVKSFALSFCLYLLVLGLTLLEGDEFSDLFFGRILMAVIYIGPIFILLALAKDIIRERERRKNDN
jgi:hypothetical protein